MRVFLSWFWGADVWWLDADIEVVCYLTDKLLCCVLIFCEYNLYFLISYCLSGYSVEIYGSHL